MFEGLPRANYAPDLLRSDKGIMTPERLLSGPGLLRTIVMISRYPASEAPSVSDNEGAGRSYAAKERVQGTLVPSRPCWLKREHW